jgi:hypothetical protein
MNEAWNLAYEAPKYEKLGSPEMSIALQKAGLIIDDAMRQARRQGQIIEVEVIYDSPYQRSNLTRHEVVIAGFEARQVITANGIRVELQIRTATGTFVKTIREREVRNVEGEI